MAAGAQLRLAATQLPLRGQRIAVTGAGGFLGTHLAARLSGAGATVVRLDHAPRGVPAGPVAELRGCEAIVHLAYRAPRPGSFADQFRDELELNAVPTARLLRAAEECGVRHVCLASSTSVYAPLRGLTEDGPLHPEASPYARAKLEQESLVRRWAERVGGQAAILRLSTVYGPGEKPHSAIPAFIRAALRGRPLVVAGAGLGPFDPVYVLDVVDAFVAASGRRASGTFNIAAGEPRLPLAVARLVCRLARSTPPIVHDWRAEDRARPICDVSRAAAELGFRASTPLAAGLRAEIRWTRGAA